MKKVKFIVSDISQDFLNVGYVSVEKSIGKSIGFDYLINNNQGYFNGTYVNFNNSMNNEIIIDEIIEVLKIINDQNLGDFLDLDINDAREKLRCILWID